MFKESEYKGGALEAEDYKPQTYYEILGVSPSATPEEIKIHEKDSETRRDSALG